MDFTIPVDHRIMIKESVEIEKYLDLARKVKKLLIMMVSGILIIADALGMGHKGLEKRLSKLNISRRIETIQTTALLKLARILRRVLET